MKQCFFHLGFHKTASTYLQTVIDRSRNDALRAFHVVNRDRRQETRPLKRAMAVYGQTLTAKTCDGAAAECTRIIEAFEASGKDRLLLSDEALLGPMLR